MRYFFIVERLKAYFQVNNDYQVAYRLGVKQNTISAWKRRSTVDYALLITKCDKANLNWLFKGEGTMMFDEADVGSPPSSLDMPPGPCQQCQIRERLIQSQQKTIENLEARLETQDGQKRKVG